MAPNSAPFSKPLADVIDNAAARANSSASDAVCHVHLLPTCSTICQSRTLLEISEASAAYARRSCIGVWLWTESRSSRAIAMSRFLKVRNA
jgi:hypothetical protein